MAAPPRFSRSLLAAAAAFSLAAVSSLVAPVHDVRLAGTRTFDVTAFGATGNGVSDDTAAIQAAIDAAQAGGGGTVYLPAGTYAITHRVKSQAISLRIEGAAPVTLKGAGRDLTRLVEHVVDQHLLRIKTSGSVVEGVTLDTQTYNALAAIVVAADNTTLAQARVLGGSNFFALYYAGGGGATPANPRYNTGNKVLDTDIVDQRNDDGFSFSFQAHALIHNITHHGSRLALYIDTDVTVDGYTYTPGTMQNVNGFWITAPAANITINNFVTYGSGGKVGGGRESGVATNIVIRGERFLGASGECLEIANVNGLTVDGASLNEGNRLVFDPMARATGIVVENSTLPAVYFQQKVGATVDGASFVGDTFPAYTVSGKPRATFQDWNGAATSFSVSGGSFGNALGGLAKGSGMHYTTTKLKGI